MKNDNKADGKRVHSGAGENIDEGSREWMDEAIFTARSARESIVSIHHSLHALVRHLADLRRQLDDVGTATNGHWKPLECIDTICITDDKGAINDQEYNV
ncbi:hypothetical protein [Paenibacillus glycinis]|uniref:Uncharacterized protein n=1 Tax=Paenibacillus glycinis TaxID=2697035 RepID=A0ABW9XLV4_9BACL|nr:hypothetical protein [Paenibacillus glycinis]NBD23589.1 hypothetical protein [Paenibacillus glycinis]